jgi:cell division protein FtsL
MKNFILKTTWLIVAILVVINLFVFISGIILSDEIGNFEQKTDNLRKVNLNLEKEVASLGSLKFATEQAKKLGFTNLSAPQSLDQLRYAYRP